MQLERKSSYYLEYLLGRHNLTICFTQRSLDAGQSTQAKQLRQQNAITHLRMKVDAIRSVLARRSSKVLE